MQGLLSSTWPSLAPRDPSLSSGVLCVACAPGLQTRQGDGNCSILGQRLWLLPPPRPLVSIWGFPPCGEAPHSVSHRTTCFLRSLEGLPRPPSSVCWGIPDSQRGAENIPFSQGRSRLPGAGVRLWTTRTHPRAVGGGGSRGLSPTQGWPGEQRDKGVCGCCVHLPGASPRAGSCSFCV